MVPYANSPWRVVLSAPTCGRCAALRPRRRRRPDVRTVNPLPNVVPSSNVAPLQYATRRCAAIPRLRNVTPTCRNWDCCRRGPRTRPRHNGPIDARAETVATSGPFRGAFKAHRCIVTVDAFYEWRATETEKQPSAIARHDWQPMAIVRLSEGFRWPGDTITRTFAIVTTTVSADLAGLHDRMPVGLGPGD